MRLIAFLLMAGAALAAPTKRTDWREDFFLVEETGLKVAAMNFALDNKDWVSEEKQRAIIWDYHGGDNQRWLVFNRAGGAGASSMGKQTFRLQRKNSDFCLNFYHDSTYLN